MAPIFKSLALLVSCFAVANAVTMKNYKPAWNVQPAFKFYLNVLYLTAEDTTATTAFTDFFTAEGNLTVLSYTTKGAAEILQLKQRLLPPSGPIRWNHLPNTTTIASHSATQTVYEVLGVIQTISSTAGNCSQAYYTSQFTIKKDAHGKPMIGELGGLIKYHDIIVAPLSPTNIPCDD